MTTNAALLDERFVGREYDRAFVAELPEEVDPCGENGEFHTVCYAGGMFRIPVEFSLGKPMRRTYSAKLEDGTVQKHAYCSANLILPENS